MPAADGVGFEEQRNGVRERLAVPRDRLALLKTHDDLFGLDDTVVAPGGTPMIGLTILMPLSGSRSLARGCG